MVHEDILLHLVNHATYHHGFVSTLLYTYKNKGADEPPQPNAGVLRYEAGEGFIIHRHDFAQVWYVI